MVRGKAREAETRKEAGRFDPGRFLARLDKGTTETQYRENTRVYAQGDPGDAVFFNRRGRVKLSIVSRQGKEAVIALLNGGSFFGESCLNGQIVRSHTATTITACTISRIPKKTMVSALLENRKFSGFFVGYVVSRNQHIEDDLVDQLFNSSEKRLARLLLVLAHFGKDGRTEIVVPRVSQEMLAGMVGTTRARVTHFMHKFRKLGFVNYDRFKGDLSIHSSLMNVILHD